jgi:hypothetical protein
LRSDSTKAGSNVGLAGEVSRVQIYIEQSSRSASKVMQKASDAAFYRRYDRNSTPRGLLK